MTPHFRLFRMKARHWHKQFLAFLFCFAFGSALSGDIKWLRSEPEMEAVDIEREWEEITLGEGPILTVTMPHGFDSGDIVSVYKWDNQTLHTLTAVARVADGNSSPTVTTFVGADTVTMGTSAASAALTDSTGSGSVTWVDNKGNIFTPSPCVRVNKESGSAMRQICLWAIAFAVCFAASVYSVRRFSKQPMPWRQITLTEDFSAPGTRDVLYVSETATEGLQFALCLSVPRGVSLPEIVLSSSGLPAKCLPARLSERTTENGTAYWVFDTGKTRFEMKKRRFVGNELSQPYGLTK